MKRMIIILIFLLINSLFFGASLERTSSNTILFTEDFAGSTYILSGSTHNELYNYGTGMVRTRNMQTGSWAGPANDIVAYTNGSALYAVGQWIVHSKIKNTPVPNGALNGQWQWDNYLMMYNTAGTKRWANSVRLRSTNEDSINFNGNVPLYVNLAVDESNGDVYAAWIDYRNSGGSWKYVPVLQKVTNAGVAPNEYGVKPWANEIVINNGTSLDVNNTAGVGITILDDFVYLAYWGTATTVTIVKINKSTGAIVTGPSQVNATAHGNVRHVRVMAGLDKHLYVVWNSTEVNVWAQRIDTNLNRATWGGNTSDKQINVGSGYSYGNFWYAWTENNVNIDMDDKTNMYVVWSASKDGAFNTFVQKVNYESAGFTRMWTGGGNDVKISDDTSFAGDVYSDVSYYNNNIYISYVTHDTDKNDVVMLKKVDANTGVIDLTFGKVNTGLAHTSRLVTYASAVYVIGNGAALRAFNLFGYSQTFNQTGFTDKSYVTRFYFATDRVMVGTPMSVRLTHVDTVMPTGSYFRYWVSPDAGTTFFPEQAISNATGSTIFSNFTTLGNKLRLYVVGDNEAGEGNTYIGLRKYTLEALKIYLGDIMVGKSPSGADAVGDLILNETALDQVMNNYVFANGTSAASGYFFIKNNGNVATNFKITATTGSGGWTVKYWLCDSSGNTNQDITSSLTSDAFTTNISPFNNNEWVVIRAFATPTNGMPADENFTVYLSVYAQLPSGSFSALHDVAGLNAIVSTALPDLVVRGKGQSIGETVINSDGVGQTVYQLADTNVDKVFYTHIKNAGGSDNIKLYATNYNMGDANNWTYKFYTNSINVAYEITTNLTNQTLGLTVMLDNEGWFSNIITVISPKTTATLNSECVITFIANSVANESKVDFAKISLRRVNTKMDLVTENIGAGVYNTNLVNQIYTNFSDNTITSTYTVRVSNVGSYAMDMYLLGSMSNTLNPAWKVDFFDDAVNITTILTNSFYTISNLAVNANKNITVRIITPLIHNIGANEVMGTYFLSVGEGDTNNGSKYDVCGIQHRLISSLVDLALDGNAIGVYDPTPSAAQTVFKYIKANTNFNIVVSNSANSSYRVRTRITSPSGVGVNVVYTNNGNDITSALSNYWTNDFAAGGFTNISVWISTNDIGIGGVYEATIESESLVNPADIDAVKYRVERAVAPDLLIKRQTEITWNGDDQYIESPSGSVQETGSSYPQGGTNWYRYLFKVYNDRPFNETNLVRATLSSTGWHVQFYRYTGPTPHDPDPTNVAHWSNMTSVMTNNGFTNWNVAFGSYHVFKAEVKANTATNEGDNVIIDITAMGVATRFEDKARIIVNYGIGRPDLVYNVGVNPFTNWNNFYTTTYTQAVATNYTDKAKGTLLPIVIQNDAVTIDGSFIVKGSGQGDSWHVTYYNEATNDITAAMTWDGFLVSVSKQSNVTIYVKVDAANTMYSLNMITNIDIKVASDEQEQLIDCMRIVTILTDLGKPDFVLGDNANNVYSTNEPPMVGTNIQIGKGDTTNIDIVLQNDRNTNEVIRVYASEGLTPWTLTFSTNGVDVTTAIINNFVSGRPYNGGLDIPLAANSSITIRATLTLSSNSVLSSGDTRDFTLYAYSEGRLVQEGVVFRATVADFGKPDIASIASWDGHYETVPSLQIVSTNTEKGWWHVYSLDLQNDRNRIEEFKFSGNGSSSNWIVQYYYVTNNITNDVTASVTNSNYLLILDAQTSNKMLIKTYISNDATNNLDTTFTVNMELKSWMGFVKDTARLTYTIKDLSRPDLKLTNGLWNDTYESIAIGPASTTNFSMEKGDKVILYLNIENDSLYRTNDYYFYAKSAGYDWQVKYYYTNTNIFWGQEITAGLTITSNYLITIAPTQQELYYIEITIPSNATMPINTVGNIDMELISRFGIQKDLGRFAITYVDNGNPDLVLGAGIGDGVREPTNTTIQVSNVALERGDVSYINFYAQNDRSDKTDFLKLTGGSPASGVDFNIQYFIIEGAVTNDITTHVTNFNSGSNYSVGYNPSSQKQYLVKLTHYSNSTVLTNSLVQIPLQFVSFGGSYNDNISLNYRVRDLSMPNIYITNNSVWSNAFEPIAPINQITNIVVEMGHTNIIDYYIENSRAKSEELIYKAIGARANWNIDHYYYSGVWNNVNDGVTNAWTNTFTGNSRRLMRMVVYVPYDYAEAFTNEIGDSVSVDMSLQSWMGYNFDRSRFRYVLQDLGKPNILKSDLDWTEVEETITNQIESIFVEKGITNVYELVLKNDRNTYDSFFLSANLIEWNSKIYLITNNTTNDITADITNKILLKLTNNEIQRLYLVHYADYSDTNKLDSTKTMNITFTSFKRVTIDSVRLNFIMKDLSKPDIIVNGIHDGDYAYNGVPQSNTNLIEKGETIKYIVWYQNDSDYSYNYVFKATGVDSNWLFLYNVSNGSDFTNMLPQMTNNGFTNFFVTKQSNYGEIEITLLSNSSLPTNTVLINSVRLYPLTELNVEQVSLITRVVDRGNPILRFTDGYQNTNLLMKKNDVKTFNFTLSNGRTNTTFEREDILVVLSPDVFAGWTYEVRVAGLDITTEVTNGGRLLNITNGDTTNLTVTVTMNPDNLMPSGSTNNIELVSYSQGRGRVSLCTISATKQEPTPDITVVSVSGIGTVGDNVYGETEQTIVGYLVVNSPAIYSVILENDDLIEDEIVFDVSGNLDQVTKWKISIVDDAFNQDVTQFLKDGVTNTMVNGSAKMFILTISNAGQVGMNETNTLVFTARSTIDTNKFDRITIHTIRVPIMIEGSVQTKKNAPIKDAKVTLKSLYNTESVIGVSDTNGNFNILGAAGSYLMTIQAKGYVDETVLVNVKELRTFNIGTNTLLPLNIDETTFNAHSFPNPAKERQNITILVNHITTGNLMVQLYTLEGKLLKKFINEEKEAGVHTIKWDGRDDTGKYVTRGIYLLMIYDGTEAKTKKIYIK